VPTQLCSQHATAPPRTYRKIVENTANNMQDLRVGNKYRIGRKIGSGSFGDIYLGKTVQKYTAMSGPR
jgi:serine/threonine protein kinase